MHIKASQHNSHSRYFNTVSNSNEDGKLQKFAS